MTAFYLPVGPTVVHSTEHTSGPWAPTDQHGGPPAALLCRALESVLPDGGWLARISVNLLGPVPLAELEVTARVVRPGRSVQQAEAELAVDGRPVARANGWWHRLGDTAAVATVGTEVPELPEPSGTEEPWPCGYVRAMDWRWSRGQSTEPGPATVWLRMRMPLVEGEETTPTQRVMAAADCGNGISATVPLRSWLYVNTELTVHLLRPPTGEWVCLDAATEVGPTGGGIATSRLFDSAGPVGRSAQALLIRPR
jgi:acyl-coenzyme A thioesterase PaaI-like protein